MEIFFKPQENVINLFNEYAKIISEDFGVYQKPSNLYFSLKNCHIKLSDTEERQEKLRESLVR